MHWRKFAALVFALIAAMAIAPAVATAQVSAKSIGTAQAGWVVIHSYYGSGRQCLDADANTGGNGTKVQVWDCNYQPQQLWWAENGFLINGKFQTKCLDADTNGGGRNGTKVQLWDCNWQSQQRWWTRTNDLAIYNERFLNNWNTVLDRDTNVPGNGARAQLWQKNFQSQQWWWIEYL